MNKIIALGDCNTSGVGELEYKSYPERFAKRIGKEVVNLGFTMSTTREMLHLFNDNYHQHQDIEIIMIQYGLVDSWKTFKYAPYVLYYPDNIWRKIARKIIKKYKKVARKRGLNDLFGTKNVVDKIEYRKNIIKLIEAYPDKQFILVETLPNLDSSRNEEIKKYNEILSDLDDMYENVLTIYLYNDFLNNRDCYADETHLNERGYDKMTDLMMRQYSALRDIEK